MVKFNFNYKNKKFQLDVEKCNSYFSRARGLMFRTKSKPLLFVFGKVNRQPIHSWFCVPFIAIWFNENNIIDVKSVKPWIFSVLPREKFDKLLEIPANDKSFNSLKLLILE